MKEKKKITEDHRFKISDIEKGSVSSIFKLAKYRDEYIILLRLEKTLQGDRFDPIEAYQIDTPEKNMTLIREYMKNNETVLANYRMQFLWTFVAFAGLRNKNLSLYRKDDSYSSGGSRDGGSSLVVDEESDRNMVRTNIKWSLLSINLIEINFL